MFMRIIAFLIAVAAGIAASQGPEIAQQYRQRLGGAIDELARIIQNFDADSAKSGYDRTSALAVMARNNEQLVRDQALRMAETTVRHAHLSDQQKAFDAGGPFSRLTALVDDFDRPLIEATLRDFEPAVPTTVEGVAFAGGGFLVIYILLRGLGFLLRPRRRRIESHA